MPDGTIERHGLGPSRSGLSARRVQMEHTANGGEVDSSCEVEPSERLDLDPDHDSDHEDTLNPDTPAGGDFKVRFWIDD
ncbi:MAG: hypothetical protein IT410_01945 [Candidatus Doudnabacteria bacterium]|nr:hypothetical protein [Candidatus Doudnabacteria bacterium]